MNNITPPPLSGNLLPILRTSTGAEPFYSSSWDPSLISFNHAPNFEIPSAYSKSSTPLTLESHDIVLPDMVPPKLPCFECGSFPEFPTNLGLYHCEDTINNAKSQDHHQTSERRPQLGGRSSSAKRRRKEVDSCPLFDPHMKPDDGLQQKDSSGGLQELALNDKKKKYEHESLKNVCVKEDGPTKQDYVHVRARRGQATNSHSLAERVRREKISERMKMLEELVPGCNKITGKAVMLDEIINYVQSLQRQVEFLSMKLASVNPESNINMGGFASKDSSSVDEFSDGLKCWNLYPPPLADSQLHSMLPEGVALWDNGIHNLFEMGYESSNLGTTNGGPKSE